MKLKSLNPAKNYKVIGEVEVLASLQEFAQIKHIHLKK